MVLCLHMTLIGTKASPVKGASVQVSGETGEQSNEGIQEGNLVEQLWKRTYFPDYPPSCQICEMHYDEIDSCANASIVFANVSAVSGFLHPYHEYRPNLLIKLLLDKQVLFNPGYFIDVIQCACADTFQSYYPQCVDCFTQTNQTGFLEPNNGEGTNSVVDGIRQICALYSTLFGGVASVNSQLPGQTPITVDTSSAALRRYVNLFGLLANSGEIRIIAGTMFMGFFMGVWSLL
jgi:hypothetical protein